MCSRYDCVNKLYFDRQTLKQYLSFHQPEEFERVRRRTIKVTDAIIFQDPETNLFYYPKNGMDGRVVVMKPPLIYDEHTKTYFDPETMEQYLQIRDLEGLKKIKNDSKLQKIVPIYFDPAMVCFYYPEITNMDRADEVICIDKDPLFLGYYFFNPLLQIETFIHTPEFRPV